MSTIFEHFSAAVRAGQLVAMATVVAGPDLGSKLLIHANGRLEGSTTDAEADQAIQEKANALLTE